MDKKGKLVTAAVIDIGSNALNMSIGQAVNDGEIKVLESLTYPISLGKDTFNTGRISFEKVNKTCEIIKNFLSAAKEYDVTYIKAVATTAVREAQNREFVLDQIQIRTGLCVEVLDDSAEKTLIYKEVIRRISTTKIYKSPALMVYIGGGNLGVAVYDAGTLPLTQNIRIGSLRLSEMLFNMQEYEEQYSIVIEDYLRGFKETFYNTLPTAELKHFIASGREIPMIVQLCKGEIKNGFYHISKEKFTKMYEELKNKTAEQIMEDYDIQEESAELLRYAISIYNMLLNATSANRIIAPVVFVSDSVLFELLRPKKAAIFNREFERNTVLSAEAVAGRYSYDATHAAYVEKYSLKIFDKLKKMHGLGEKERLYLQVAAIMHDVGKYINIRGHYQHSYEIIKSSEIVGLDMHEMELVACITKYHSTITPALTDYDYNRLSPQDRIVVSKLTAILRISEALDKGHIKKFEDIDIKIKDNTMVIGISTLNNTQIEEWSFASKRVFFEEVYGMKAVIKKKKVVES